MNFLNVRERLEEVHVQFFLPQSIDLPNTEQTNPISDSTIGRRIFRYTVMEKYSVYLLVGELVIAEEAGDDLLPLSGDVKLLLEPLGGGDNVTGGGTAAVESLGDLVAAIGQGIDLVLHAIQGLLRRTRRLEEVDVDGEASLLDARSEIAPRLRGIFGIEG